MGTNEEVAVDTAVQGEQPLALEEIAEPQEPSPVDPPKQRIIPEPKAGGAPAWSKVPADMRFPRGRQVLFVRFEAAWTDSPHKGDRQCIIWGLTDIDEKAAFGRAMSDPNRAANELAKQMVRSIDGHVTDWSGTEGPANIDLWWREIGGKCRQMLIRLYTQLHVLPDEDRKRFFESCIEVRSTG